VQRDHLLIQVVGVALLAATGAAGADEVYRLVSDARYARAGADGSVFVLAGKREPTPGAWIQDCEGLADSLTRVDGKTGVVLWSTCLPFRAENVAVDAGGAVTIAGAVTGARATPGAFSSPGGDEIAVVRLNPAGTAADWIATVAGNLSYPYAGAATWTAIGPDGSVYGAIHTPRQPFQSATATWTRSARRSSVGTSIWSELDSSERRRMEKRARTEKWDDSRLQQ
jgi:hypothetical protein